MGWEIGQLFCSVTCVTGNTSCVAWLLFLNYFMANTFFEVKFHPTLLFVGLTSYRYAHAAHLLFWGVTWNEFCPRTGFFTTADGGCRMGGDTFCGFANFILYAFSGESSSELIF
jgi:hypothetical protein